MLDRDQAHVTRITNRFQQEATAKYEKGVREHGGHLADKPAMMRMLRDEVLDFVIYQDTLEEQLRGVLRLLRAGRAAEATTQLEAILNGEPD